VGVTYTSTLANSAGFVAAAATVIISAYFLVYRRWYKHGRQVQGGSTSGRGTGQKRSRSASGTVTVARWILVLASLFALVGIAAIPVGAHYAGKAVRDGRPASTPYFLTIFPILEIHARPVTVQSTSKDPSAIDRLPMGHNLFYLGRSNGKIVIYDSTAHQALYFPDSAVIMRVSNCYGRQPVHSICKERYRYNISWSPE
jgi:hypothetical protein